MRFLHSGDLHLDGAFGFAGERDAEAQREQGRALLKRIFDAARSESCDMILIAGDLFDSRFVTPDTAELFCRLVEECDIPVVLSPGNHDFYSESSFYAKAWKRLGEKLTLFTSPELQIFDFDSLGLKVFGYAFTSASLTDSPLLRANVPEEDGSLRIFCGHADIFSPISRYAPITTAELSKFDFAYSALGHVHIPSDFDTNGGRVRYCGFAQGCGFDELGAGQVLIVDADKDSCEVRALSLSEREYRILRTKSEASADILCEEIKHQGYIDNTYLRIVLEGNAEEVLGKSSQALAEEIKEKSGLPFVEIRDERLPFLDGAYLERDMTLRGELYRVLKAKLSSEDAEERQNALNALRIGLAAIDGRPFFDVCD